MRDRLNPAIAFLFIVLTGTWIARAAVAERPGQLTVVLSETYAPLSLEQRIDAADLVLVGRVTDISPARWNQDGGKFWESRESQDQATPYHEIRLRVLRSILEKTVAGAEVVVTVAGNSPTPGKDLDAPVMVGGTPEHNLVVGDEVVIFAQRTEMAWRDGFRSVLGFVGDPLESYAKLGSDGLCRLEGSPEPVSLDQLIEKIRQRRGRCPSSLDRGSRHTPHVLPHVCDHRDGAVIFMADEADHRCCR